MTDDNTYQKHRRRQAAKASEQSAEARDIGPIPKVKNAKRRATCERDLKKFLTTYFPESFPLPFSDDHLRILKDIEQRAIDGGLKAIAMPRGSGKTTILLRALLWVLAYAHRRFGVLVEADEGAAEESLDTIKIEWETNDLLLEDFPEIAYPIRCLEGITQRGNAQTSQGARTLVGWKRKELVFPTIAGSKSSGAVIRVAGILGRIRGMMKTGADGKTFRPDFVLVNDPQTDTSALSDPECAKREKVVGGAVLGLAGPGKRISGFGAVTVIREGDMADRMLNRLLMPKWHGERCKLVYEWPTDTEHWKQYFEIRSDEIAEGVDDHPKATSYYRKHRAAMDAGSMVGWPRKATHELSALQHAMDLRYDHPDTFDAEYQNSPRPLVSPTEGITCLTSDQYCLRTIPTHKRGECPDWVDHVTLGVDVQGSSLWWVVCGIGSDFRGMVLDYGVWPDQGIDYLTLSDVERTMIRVTGMRSPTAALLEGLNRLRSERLAVEYTRDDGGQLRVSQMVVDSGYQAETVYQFSQAHPNVIPSHGRGVTARQRPWVMERPRRGERMGYGWRMPPTRGTRAPRYVLVDTNTWKTKLNECWQIEGLDAPGAWWLYKAAALRHRMIADHLASEYPTKTAGHGRELYEWAVRPNRDNHLLDALILAAVGASLQGVKIPGESERKTIRRHVAMRRDERSPELVAAMSVDSDPASVSAATPAKTRRVSMSEMRAVKRSKS